MDSADALATARPVRGLGTGDEGIVQRESPRVSSTATLCDLMIASHQVLGIRRGHHSAMQAPAFWQSTRLPLLQRFKTPSELAPSRANWTMLGHGRVPRSSVELAGEGPVTLVDKQPCSWWVASGEAQASKPYYNVALGGKEACAPHDEKSCASVVSTPGRAGNSGSRASAPGAKTIDGRRASMFSAEGPVGVMGAEPTHTSTWRARDPSCPRHQRPQARELGVLGEVAKPATGRPGKWWSAERKSEEFVVARIGRISESVVAKYL